MAQSRDARSIKSSRDYPLIYGLQKTDILYRGLNFTPTVLLDTAKCVVRHLVLSSRKNSQSVILIKIWT